jgi:hypothetical protein
MGLRIFENRTRREKIDTYGDKAGLYLRHQPQEKEYD